MKVRSERKFLKLELGIILLLILLGYSPIINAESVIESRHSPSELTIEEERDFVEAMATPPDDWTYFFLDKVGNSLSPTNISSEDVRTLYAGDKVAITLESSDGVSTFNLNDQLDRQINGVQKIIFRNIEAYLDFVKGWEKALVDAFQNSQMLLTIHRDITVPGGAGTTGENEFQEIMGTSTGLKISWNCIVRSEKGHVFTVRANDGAAGMNLIEVRGGKQVYFENLVIDGAGVARTLLIRDALSHGVLNGNVTLQNGKNTVQGGGILVYINTKLSMQNMGNQILNCSADQVGGGIFTMLGSESLISDATFSQNKADRGAAFFVLGKVTIKDSQFIENTANISAGAVYLYFNESQLKASDVQLSIQNSFFSRNAAKSGGALVLDKEVDIYDSSFLENQAQVGGALYINRGKTTINASTMNGNNAPKNGGAIYLSNQAKLELLSTQFLNNRALEGQGGAIHVESANYDKTYTKIVPVEAYQNLIIDRSSVFQNNKSSFSYQAPDNAKEFLNLQFKSTSFTALTNPHTGASILQVNSLLNNDDINHMHLEDGGLFSDFTLYPVTYSFQSKNGEKLPPEVNALLPESGKALLNSIVIPSVIEEKQFKVQEGIWTFENWDQSSSQMVKGGLNITGYWSFSETMVSGEKPEKEHPKEQQVKEQAPKEKIPKALIPKDEISENEAVDGEKIVELPINAKQGIQTDRVVMSDHSTFIEIKQDNENYTVLPKQALKRSPPQYNESRAKILQSPDLERPLLLQQYVRLPRTGEESKLANLVYFVSAASIFLALNMRKKK